MGYCFMLFIYRVLDCVVLREFKEFKEFKGRFEYKGICPLIKFEGDGLSFCSWFFFNCKSKRRKFFVFLRGFIYR